MEFFKLSKALKIYPVSTLFPLILFIDYRSTGNSEKGGIEESWLLGRDDDYSYYWQGSFARQEKCYFSISWFC